MTDDAYVLTLDGMQQSIVVPGDPTRLVFDYMRRIGDLLDAVTPAPPVPLRVLHVGGAAMTLPRYLAATRPGSRQIVLEPAADVVEQVRAEMPLPPRSGIKVRIVDGASGIGEVREESQDVVILDAFAGGEVPPDLTTRGFLTEVRRVLVGDGVFVVNLTDRAPFPLVRDVVATLRDVAPEPVAVTAETATLKARRPGNVVVAWGRLPAAPFGVGSGHRVFGGRAVSDSFGGGRVR